MADIDNLTIEISADATSAYNALDKLSEALGKVLAQLDKLDPSKLKDLANTTETLNQNVSKLGESGKKVEDLANTLNKAGQNVENVAKVGTAAQGASKYLEDVRRSASGAARSLKEVGSSAGGGGIFGNLSKHVSTFVSSLGSATSYLKAMGRVARGFFSTITAPIRGATKAMHKFGSSSNVATTSAKKLVKELTRVGKMLKLMVTRMALRAVIKEVGNGFKSLALHSEEFNSAMSSVINGSKKLGYSFAAMVSPLINALAPAIVYIINLLTRLLNILNQVFSALSGKGTWNKAKDFTDDWASDIKSANKAAKELKKTVLGFDELNQLQEKTSGGGASNDIVDMFETVPIDEKWKDIADWIKKMWKLGDFAELGTKIGKKLQQMLRSIPWDDIRKTAKKIGKSLATLINGFVEVEKLGYDIGTTIAQSINTVFEFLNGFVHNLHWDSIGKFIADTFNGFFEKIDWKLIKDTVVTGMAGIAEAIQNFIDTFHWDNLSNFVINAVDTISSGIKKFVDGVDWQDLGVKIADQINKAIEGIDWKNVGETLGGVIEASIDWAYGLITTFNVDDAVTALEDFLDGVCEAIDFEKAGATLGTALHKLISVIEKFWANEENRKKIKQAIFDFFKGIFDSMTAEDWEFIGSTLGALALIKTLQTLIAGSSAGLKLTVVIAVAYAGLKLGGKIGEYLTGEKSTYQNFSWWGEGGFMETVFGGVGGVDDAIKRLGELKTAWYDMGWEANKWIKIITTGISLWLDPIGTLVDKMERLAGYKFNWETMSFEKLKTDTEKSAEALDLFKQKADEAKEKMRTAADQSDNMGERFVNTHKKVTSFSEAMNNLKEKNEKTTTSFSKAVSDMEGNVNKSFDNVFMKYHTTTEQVELETYGLNNTMTGQWNEISKGVDNSSEDILKSTDKLKKAFDENNWTFDGIGDGLTKSFKKAKDGIKSVWNSIAEKLNGRHEVGGSSFSIDLPIFAAGGFPEDGLFMANHGEMVGRFSNGKTAVANNEQIVDGIAAGVYNAVSSAMASYGRSDTPINNVIYVDGEVLARCTTKAQERQNRRFSPSMG